MTASIEIGISTKHRQDIADGLGRLLADTWVLYGKTHGFHWNVTGPMFTSLHGMFDTQYNELWESLDEIAERIRALGLPAPFGDSTLTKLASIEEASSIPSAMDMVKQLMTDHEAVARGVRRNRTGTLSVQISFLVKLFFTHFVLRIVLLTPLVFLWLLDR